MSLTDEELYKGFTKEQRERYQREAREMWGSARVEESEQRAKKMSRAEWEAVGAEGEAVTAGIAALADRDPGDPEVQALIARHHAWVEHFYPCSAEVYRGLGQLYVEHPEFRAFYEKRRAGLADLAAAIPMLPQQQRAVKARHKDHWEGDLVLQRAIAAANARLGTTGRILVRPSGTEPALRVMVEGSDEALVAELADSLAALAGERLD